jgi:hypothetical protein
MVEETVKLVTLETEYMMTVLYVLAGEMAMFLVEVEIL